MSARVYIYLEWLAQIRNKWLRYLDSGVVVLVCMVSLAARRIGRPTLVVTFRAHGGYGVLRRL